MSVSYNNQADLTDYFIKVLENDLSGRNSKELYGRPPADRYQLGVIGPLESTGVSLSQPEISDKDDVSLDDFTENFSYNNPTSSSNKHEQGATNAKQADISLADLEEEDGEKNNIENILTKRGVPSALGCEFVLSSSETLTLDISAAFSFYTRRFPTYDQVLGQLHTDAAGKLYASQKTLQIEERYVRHEVSTPSIDVYLDKPFFSIGSEFIQEKIREILLLETKQEDVWRDIPRQTLPSGEVLTSNGYKKYLQGLTADVSLPPIKVDLEIRTKEISKHELRVGVYLVNKTVQAENFIDNVTRFIIDARLSIRVNGEILPIEIHTSPESYQYDPYVMAVGRNCSVSVEKLENSALLRTKALATFKQYRLVTKDNSKAEFKELAKNPLPLLQKIYEEMIAYYSRWENKLNSGEVRFRNRIEEKYGQLDLQTYQNEISRFKNGIDTLASDRNLLEAFKAMHRVFERIGANRGITQWRLFQLGFIVTQLESLAVREGSVESDTLEYADVLWFPTGGGKTEAYLGLISCTLLYDRLRGKKFGVSVWLRFPLRMLSVQQLQRAVAVIHETEKERKKIFDMDDHNVDPFGLGYFVGKSSTPNQLSDDPRFAGKWKLSEIRDNPERKNELRMIRDCPECASEDSVNIEVDVTKRRILHVCKNCGEKLGIFLSDDEIYRYLPSVLIGTVDKLPSVSWQKNFSMLWSGPEKRCSQHGYMRGKYCIVYGCNEKKDDVTPYDPGPALQIQDELHLLREELGTFAGHYETLAARCQIESNKLPPKILAATATVEGLPRQTKHLYGVKARRFPTRGYELGESFYTTLKKNDDGIEIARKYIGFRPAFLRSPDASSLVLEILHREIRELYSLLDSAGLQAFIDRTKVCDIHDLDSAMALLDKYDTTLTYVGSKAHGSRVERSLDSRIGKNIKKAGSRQLGVSYLNGESSLDDIADTIQKLEKPSTWNEEERLDAVIGTSLVSHGVDVSRFNLMVVSGMPGRTAEYIQSSSRSGRRFLGLIIVVFNPWLLRDASLYHRFETYHYHMEHLVEPVPINRFSKFAVNKTLPGMFAGLLNAYYSPKLGTALTKSEEYSNAIFRRELTEEDIRKTLYSAYGIDRDIYAEGLTLSMKEQVDKRFNVEIRNLRSPSGQRIPDIFSTKPMFSLRDIDTPVDFEPKANLYSTLRWLDR